MKFAKAVVTLGFVAASASSLLFLPQASSKPKTGERATRYRVIGKTVYVRNKIAGFVIGTLSTNEAIDVQKPTSNGTWGYGYAYGNAKRPGWVLMKDDTGDLLRREGQENARPVAAQYRSEIPPEEFASDKNSIDCPGKSPSEKRQSRCTGNNIRIPNNTVLLRNLGSNENAITLTRTDGKSNTIPVKWRYVTRDGNFVLINAPTTYNPKLGGYEWGFIPRGACPSELPHDNDCTKREGCGGG